MSYRIEKSITINAPASVVWTVIQDTSRRLEWDARITAAQLLTPLPVGKGSRSRISYSMFGMPMQIEIEMVTWEPFSKSAVRGTVVGTTDTIGGSWHFTEHADGSTTWTTKLLLKSQGRLAGLREWINGRMTDRLTILSQQNLKRLIESEYHPQTLNNDKELHQWHVS